MSNTSYLKILFNSIFVVTLAIVTLNACQDSGGRKPVNKAKSGKGGLQKPSGTPSATQTGSPVKPKVEDVSGEEDQVFDPKNEYTEVSSEEKEKLIKLFEDLNKYLNETLYYSNEKTGSKTIENYFSFTEGQLKSSKLILREVDFGSCSGTTSPFLFKSQNQTGVTTKFRFGVYDCGAKKTHDLFELSYDTQARRFVVPLNYNQLNFDENMRSKFDLSTFMLVNDLNPQCEVDWSRSNEDSIKKLNCTDLGVAFGSGESKRSRLFKTIVIDNSEKPADKIIFSFLDYAIENVGPISIKGTEKTGERIGEHLYLCETKLLNGFENCQEYKKLCDKGVDPKDAKCPNIKSENPVVVNPKPGNKDGATDVTAEAAPVVVPADDTIKADTTSGSSSGLVVPAEVVPASEELKGAADSGEMIQQ